MQYHEGLETPLGTFTINIDFNTMGMGHEIACPLVLDSKGKVVLSLADTGYDYRGCSYKDGLIEIRLNKYPYGSHKYVVSLDPKTGETQGPDLVSY